MKIDRKMLFRFPNGRKEIGTIVNVNRDDGIIITYTVDGREGLEVAKVEHLVCSADKPTAAYEKFQELNTKRLAGHYGPLGTALQREVAFLAFQQECCNFLRDTFEIPADWAYALYYHAFSATKIENPTSVMDIWFRG